MAKNLDAIKKLNPDEIKKYRKVVLDYIGEKEPEAAEKQTASDQSFSFFKKVDGIKTNKAAGQKPISKNIPEKLTPVRDNKINDLEKINLEKAKYQAAEKTKAEAARKWQEKLNQEEKEKEEKRVAEENRRLEKEKIKREKIEQEELVKKEAMEKAKRQAVEKAKAEEARKWQEKLRLEEKERAEKRMAEQSRGLEKIKRREEKKRLKLEIKMAEERAAEKKRLKRRQAIKKFKKNLKNNLSESFRVNKNNIIYNLLFFITFLAIVYIIFCLVVLRFNAGNNFIGTISRFLPVPAVVTSQGIIKHGDFQVIKDSNYSSQTMVEKRNNLVLWVILKNLRQKYGLPDNAPREALAIKFIQDEDINQVGLSRIKKISQLLKSGSEMAQLSKYADESSKAVYYSREDAREKFGPAALDLIVGQVSDVIFRDNGYYIIKRIDDKNSQLGLTYLFIGALTLDQYASEKLGRAKIFILAN